MRRNDFLQHCIQQNEAIFQSLSLSFSRRVWRWWGVFTRSNQLCQTMRRSRVVIMLYCVLISKWMSINAYTKRDGGCSNAPIMGAQRCGKLHLLGVISFLLWKAGFVLFEKFDIDALMTKQAWYHLKMVRTVNSALARALFVPDVLFEFDSVNLERDASSSQLHLLLFFIVNNKANQVCLFLS